MAIVLNDCIIENCGTGIVNKGGQVSMTGGAIIGCNDAVKDNGLGVTELSSVNLRANRCAVVQEQVPPSQSTFIEASQADNEGPSGLLKSTAELAGIFAGNIIKSQL